MDDYGYCCVCGRPLLEFEVELCKICEEEYYPVSDFDTPSY